MIFALFFFSQVAYYVAYTVVRYYTQQKMEQHLLSTIDEKACEKINYTLLQKDIQWEVNGKVFFLSGIMYDVASMKSENGSVYLYCIKETREMEMIGDLSLKLYPTGDHNSYLNDLVFATDYFPARIEMETPFPVVSEIYSPYLAKLSDIRKGILLPPPRQLIFKA